MFLKPFKYITLVAGGNRCPSARRQVVPRAGGRLQRKRKKRDRGERRDVSPPVEARTTGGLTSNAREIRPAARSRGYGPPSSVMASGGPTT